MSKRDSRLNLPRNVAPNMRTKKTEAKHQYPHPVISENEQVITFEKRIMNANISCGICKGYLRDAHTIPECLHSFCKSCILLYLQDFADCPTCKVSLGPHPIEKILYDRQLAELVERIFDDLMAEDRKTEVEFYQLRGLPQPASTNGEIKHRRRPNSSPNDELRSPSAGSSIGNQANLEDGLSDSMASMETGDGIGRKRALQSGSAAEADESSSPEKKQRKVGVVYRDQVSFNLTCDPSEKTLQSLERPFLSTSARVTINHLKKFLKLRLKLSSTSMLDILFRGEVLGMEHTLHYILKSRGVDPRSDSIIFTYRLRTNSIIAGPAM